MVVSLDEWNAMRETLHVPGGAANARRLPESIAQADDGQLEEHELIDPGAFGDGSDGEAPAAA
jgi:antitoxin YefM